MKLKRNKNHSENKIYKAVRLVSLRNLFLPVISVLIALAIYYFLPFSDVFSPVKVKNSTDAIALYNQGHKYANFNIEKLYYTGFDIMSDGEVVASYYYEITENRCVFYILNGKLVEDTPAELENVNINAKLEEPDGLLENMITSFAGTIGWTPEGVSGATGIIVVDGTAYYLERYVAGFVLILAYVIYSMTLVTINIIYILFPAIHLSLLKYYAGRPFGIRKALREIRYDFDRRQCVSAENMYITKKYFYNLGKKEVHIVPIENIVMCYEHSSLISVFGIHLRMRHTLFFVTITGGKVVSSEKKATDVTVITDYLRENYPDILWGHTKENKAEAKARIKAHKAELKERSRAKSEERLKERGKVRRKLKEKKTVKSEENSMEKTKERSKD